MTIITLYADYAWQLILLLLALFLVLIVILRWKAKSQQKQLYDFLVNIVRGFKSHADINRARAVEDQIEAFIHDLREVSTKVIELDQPRQEKLFQRLQIKDEAKPYLRSMHLEIWFNAWRTLIEAFPILGILGTIAAIGVSLHGGSIPSDAANVSEDTLATVSLIIGSFGSAIYSTAAGLVAAVVLMAINAFVEPGFARLVEQKASVREAVRTAKNHLAFTAGLGESG